jgi:hypothetical protein
LGHGLGIVYMPVDKLGGIPSDLMTSHLHFTTLG